MEAERRTEHASHLVSDRNKRAVRVIDLWPRRGN